MVEKMPFLALVRSPVKAEARGLPKNSLLKGDLSCPEEWNLEEIRAVVHLGGLVRALKWKQFEAINVEGTRRLAARIRQLDPRIPFIHLSSLAAAGPSWDGSLSAHSPISAKPCSLYGRSKMLSERAVLESGLPCTILRPCAVYGPWDTDVLALFKQVNQGLGFVAGPPSRFSLVHVEDLVEAILLALNGPKEGRIVPIAFPDPVGDVEWLQLIGQAGRKKVRVFRLPLVLAAGVAWGAESWGRLRGRAPLFGRDKYRELAAGSWVGAPEAAEKFLGFRAKKKHLEGFAQTWDWYREMGWL